MISTDFAPNERWIDSLTALRVMNLPWRWKKGNALHTIKHRLKKFFPGNELFFFLTARAGLHRLFQGLKLQPGDEVLVQGFTCEAVVLPAKDLKLKVIYVDINEDDFSMNLSDFEKKITSRSRVVLLQHSFGITPKQRNHIIRKAQSSGILVVEDLAHGFDEKVFKEDVKTIKLLSFGRSKNISSVFGGAIALTDNDLIHWFKNTEKTLKYPTFGFIYRLLLYKAFAPFIRSTYDWGLGKTLHKICTIIGLFPAEISALEKEGTYDNLFEKAYPNVLATLLLKQIKYFDLKLKKKYDAIELYETCFHTFNGHPSHTLCRYPALIQNRDKVIKSLSKHNIFLGKWYDQPVAPKSVDLKTVSYKSGSCPTAETICKQIINLPVNVRTRQARRIINLIKKYESN